MFKYKQVMVAREDLNMSAGKLAVQVAHASLKAAEEARNENREWFKSWFKEGQKKVVVSVSSKEKLDKLKEKAENLNLPNGLITDAGLTELEPGTTTVLAVGPAPNEDVDKITKKLPLLEG